MTEEERTYTLEELESKSFQEIIDELASDPNSGLGEEEVGKRLEVYGENATEEEGKNPILEFFSHFWGPIPWMIEIAAILAGTVQSRSPISGGRCCASATS